MKRLHLKHTYNTRDIGGIVNKNGYYIRENQIIRSDLPLILEELEQSFFLTNKITTVIDLRKPEDIKIKPHAMQSSEFEYFNIPIRGDKAPDRESDIPMGYINIIEDSSTILHVLNVIAEAENGVFINCNAGKDRTGVIVMLLLLIADADETDILIDYQVSYTYIRNEIRKMHQQYPGLSPFVGQSKMEYMEDTLNLFKEKYQSIEIFLENINLSKENLNRIRNKLIGDKKNKL